MLLRAFSIPVSLCFPPGSQLSFSCHQNYVVLLTSIIHLPPPQYKYQVCFSHGVRYHPGLFLAACAATETTCHARCRDVSLSVSVSTCFSSCFSDAGSIAHFRGSWFVIRGWWLVGMLPMWKCCQSLCCQFSIRVRRERAAWKAALPVMLRHGHAPRKDYRSLLLRELNGKVSSSRARS